MNTVLGSVMISTKMKLILIHLTFSVLWYSPHKLGKYIRVSFLALGQWGVLVYMKLWGGAVYVQNSLFGKNILDVVMYINTHRYMAVAATH